MRPRITTAALLAAAALGTAACGDDFGNDQIAGFATSTQPAATTEATAEVPSSGESIQKLTISEDLNSKPEIPKPAGDPPSKLYQRDIVEGKGEQAKPGDMLTMQYVGTLYDSGEQFDASWDRGEPFSFELGAGDVIEGWDQGVAGMKEGGRRLLVIPSELAYKEQGQGSSIPPNATLMFVIDLKSIG